METTEIAGLRALLWPEDGPPVASGRDASDVIGEALSVQAQMVVIPVARLSPDFLRLSTGLSQREVERRVGWKRGHLSLIERGLPPTPEQARTLRVFYIEGGETR